MIKVVMVAIVVVINRIFMMIKLIILIRVVDSWKDEINDCNMGSEGSCELWAKYK